MHDMCVCVHVFNDFLFVLFEIYLFRWYSFVENKHRHLDKLGFKRVRTFVYLSFTCSLSRHGVSVGYKEGDS